MPIVKEAALELDAKAFDRFMDRLRETASDKLVAKFERARRRTRELLSGDKDTSRTKMRVRGRRGRRNDGQ